MKKSLILTFVFAVISFAGAFAQNINRTQTEKYKQEQKTDKATPTKAHPMSETKVEKVNKGQKADKSPKGDKGKHKGHHKPFKGKGKAKGHHKNHDRKAEGTHEGHDHEKSQSRPRPEGKKRTEKNSKTSSEAPNNKSQKQGG